MIAFNEARALMMENVLHLTSSDVELEAAAGMILATQINAPEDHPRFDNSAMDGYALGSLLLDIPFHIKGEVAAGEVWPAELLPQECVRIFTGAQVPNGTAAVVMQEKCERNGDQLLVMDEGLKQGANIRLRAGSIRKGDQVMEAGQELTASAIGMLASLGVRTVNVSDKPNVAIIVTGGEFTDPHSPAEGKIFNSNGPMLAAALAGEGIEVKLMKQVDDEPELLKKELREALDKADVIITTGGVSVGDHDHIPAMVSELDLNIHFHKVAQKPGKPLLFATNDKKALFGLPGNPRAVMIGFWMYALPYLRAMQGLQQPMLRTEQIPIANDLQLKGERTELLAGQVRDGSVYILGGQNSHMLHSLTQADVIVEIPQENRMLKKNDMVKVHWLP